MRRLSFIFVALILAFTAVAAEERLDHDAFWKIRQEGTTNSGVMQTLHMLTDVHEPRLTGSSRAARSTASAASVSEEPADGREDRRCDGKPVATAARHNARGVSPEEAVMGTNLRRAMVALVVLLPGVADAQEPSTPFRPPVLPAPPPLVPDRQRPSTPLFPMPRLETPAVPAPPTAQPSPRPCGIRVVPVDPAIDPKFTKPVPESGARFPIQVITPPMPCR